MNHYFCTNSGRDCGCQPPCPPPQPPQQPPQPPAGCPCGGDFRRALDLLCSPRLQALVNFSAFAFVSDYYILGSALDDTTAGTAPGDNLAAPAGTYVCGGDSCEALSVSGSLYPPTSGAAALASTVTQAALCKLRAIAFDTVADAEGATTTNFQTVSQTLSQILRPQKPCDCANLADALTSAAAVRASTVTAGPLVVENCAIIGQLGDVLIMANSTDNRFYLICANQIDFMG